MSPVLRWEPPPPRQRDVWLMTALELRKRPGEWACVLEGHERKYAWDSCAKSLRRLGCQVKSRVIDDKTSIWARWPNGDSA